MSNGNNTVGSIRAQGRKKSNFPASQTIPSGASFDFVVEGTNFKITDTDFFAGLGVTGSIVQDGSVTGVPILDTQGSVNNIRNIEPGAGISASVSVENGLTLKHNFTFDSTGEPLTDDANATSPVLKSFLAGVGMQVTSTAQALTFTATGITTPDLAIVINKEADFEQQDASTITLASETTYLIGNSFSTNKRFICQDGAQMSGTNTFGETITYTGTGAMFTGIDARFTVKFLRMDSPSASQTFSFLDTVGETKSFIMLFSVIESTPKVGTFTNMLAVDITDFGALNAMDGITIVGTNTIIDITKMLIVTSMVSFVGVDFGTAVITEPSIFDSTFNGVPGAVAISGAASSANLPTGRIGKVVNCNFNSITPISVITTDDIRWRFEGNTDLADTRKTGLLSLSSNATETVIAVINTPVLVAGTWVVEENSHFTGDTAGRLTYNGEKPFTGPVDIAFTADKAGGGTDLFTYYLAINGSIVTASGIQVSVASGATTSATIVWSVTFAETDFVEVFVENNSNTNNAITVHAAERAN